MNLTMSAITHPARLYWWQWGKILGLCLPFLLLSLDTTQPLPWALSAHFLVDFTFQSGRTAVGKARGEWRVLAYHAFISGGYAGLIVGGVPGLAVSVIIHFLVDATDKFGFKEPVGPVLDQAAHLATLALIGWLL